MAGRSLVLAFHSAHLTLSEATREAAQILEFDCDRDVGSCLAAASAEIAAGGKLTEADRREIVLAGRARRQQRRGTVAQWRQVLRLISGRWSRLADGAWARGLQYN
jgi:hypothetical protein